MPLDVLNGRESVSLADHLTSIGVIPVPMYELNAHMIEQVRRNPPNLLFTVKPYLLMGLAAYAGIIALEAGHGWIWLLLAVLLGPIVGLATIGFTGIVATMVCHIFNIQLRGPARWVESYVAPCPSRNQPIPPAIREVADYLRKQLRCYVIYGELVQRNEVLDPYLVIEMPASKQNWLPWSGQRVCLGIWDDTGIIRAAKII